MTLSQAGLYVRMLKASMLNLSVPNISVIQDRPNRRHRICLKNVLKNVLTKEVENDTSPINVKVEIFLSFVMGSSNGVIHIILLLSSIFLVIILTLAISP